MVNPVHRHSSRPCQECLLHVHLRFEPVFVGNVISSVSITFYEVLEITRRTEDHGGPQVLVSFSTLKLLQFIAIPTEEQYVEVQKTAVPCSGGCTTISRRFRDDCRFRHRPGLPGDRPRYVQRGHCGRTNFPGFQGWDGLCRGCCCSASCHRKVASTKESRGAHFNPYRRWLR